MDERQVFGSPRNATKTREQRLFGMQPSRISAADSGAPTQHVVSSDSPHFTPKMLDSSLIKMNWDFASVAKMEESLHLLLRALRSADTATDFYEVSIAVTTTVLHIANSRLNAGFFMLKEGHLLGVRSETELVDAILSLHRGNRDYYTSFPLYLFDGEMSEAEDRVKFPNMPVVPPEDKEQEVIEQLVAKRKKLKSRLLELLCKLEHQRHHRQTKEECKTALQRNLLPADARPDSELVYLYSAPQRDITAAIHARRPPSFRRKSSISRLLLSKSPTSDDPNSRRTSFRALSSMSSNETQFNSIKQSVAVLRQARVSSPGIRSNDGDTPPDVTTPDVNTSLMVVNPPRPPKEGAKQGRRKKLKRLLVQPNVVELHRHPQNEPLSDGSDDSELEGLEMVEGTLSPSGQRTRSKKRTPRRPATARGPSSTRVSSEVKAMRIKEAQRKERAMQFQQQLQAAKEMKQRVREESFKAMTDELAAQHLMEDEAAKAKEARFKEAQLRRARGESPPRQTKQPPLPPKSPLHTPPEEPIMPTVTPPPQPPVVELHTVDKPTSETPPRSPAPPPLSPAVSNITAESTSSRRISMRPRAPSTTTPPPKKRMNAREMARLKALEEQRAAAELMAQQLQEAARKNAAVVICKFIWRRLWWSKERTLIRQRRAVRIAHARRLQQFCTAYLVRRNTQFQRQTNAAIKIQCAFRRWRATTALTSSKAAISEYLENSETADRNWGRLLTTSARMFLAKIRVEVHRERVLRTIEQRVAEEELDDELMIVRLQHRMDTAVAKAHRDRDGPSARELEEEEERLNASRVAMERAAKEEMLRQVNAATKIAGAWRRSTAMQELERRRALEAMKELRQFDESSMEGQERRRQEAEVDVVRTLEINRAKATASIMAYTKDDRHSSLIENVAEPEFHNPKNCCNPDKHRWEATQEFQREQAKQGKKTVRFGV